MDFLVNFLVRKRGTTGTQKWAGHSALGLVIFLLDQVIFFIGPFVEPPLSLFQTLELRQVVLAWRQIQ